MDVIAQRTFGLSYIVLDSIFILFFCALLFATKRRLTLLFALAGGVLWPMTFGFWSRLGRKRASQPHE